jgi:hypothetical protein
MNVSSFCLIDNLLFLLDPYQIYFKQKAQPTREREDKKEKTKVQTKNNI